MFVYSKNDNNVWAALATYFNEKCRMYVLDILEMRMFITIDVCI